MKASLEYVQAVITDPVNRIDTMMATDMGRDGGKLAYLEQQKPEVLCDALASLCDGMQTPFRVELMNGKMVGRVGEKKKADKPFVFILNSAAPVALNAPVVQAAQPSQVPLNLAEKAGKNEAALDFMELEVKRLRLENEALQREIEAAEEDADEAEKVLNEAVQQPRSFWESPAGVKVLEGLTEVMRPISQAAGMYVAGRLVPGKELPAGIASAQAPAKGADLTDEQRQQLVALENFRKANANDPGTLAMLDGLLSQYGNAPAANA